ncbi:MAG: hypothetical protein JW718_04210 [Desulfovibrionaceae bacterium]|nr:hypothetical protein [Desulfovibrionaceae bacterium]
MHQTAQQDLYPHDPAVSARALARPLEDPFPLEACLKHYRTSSLVLDLQTARDPDAALSDGLLLNVALKYFYAYVHPGAEREEVPVGEVGALYRRFLRHGSLNEPEDDIEVMNRMRQVSPGLNVMSDAPRMARILRAVADLDPGPVVRGGRFLGLDLCAGPGLLVLAQNILARRSGAGVVDIVGLEPDPAVAGRTGDLVRSLGLGRLLEADAARPESYAGLLDRDVACVTCPALSGALRRIGPRPAFSAFRALFLAAGPRLGQTVFHPQGLIVYSREVNVSLVLSRDNGFQGPPGYEGSDFLVQGLVLDNRIVPLHRLGRDLLAALDRPPAS